MHSPTGTGGAPDDWYVRGADLDDPCDTAAIVNMLDEPQRHAAGLDPIGRIISGEGFGAHAWAALAGPVATQHGRVLVLDTGTRVGAPMNGLVGLCAGFVCRPQTAADLLDVIPNRQGYLAKLYLAPEARAGGWGRRLVSGLEAHLVAHGCDNMRVDVNAFNPALGFYEEIGFQPREIALIKVL